MDYGISKNVDLPYAAAMEKVTAALMVEGFGVLTTIDVRDTLKKKLNVEFGNYAILGACNPSFAHQTLELEPMMGLFLPCNVIVYETGRGTTVAAFDPISMTSVIGNAELERVAREVRARLQRVIEAL